MEHFWTQLNLSLKVTRYFELKQNLHTRWNSLRSWYWDPEKIRRAFWSLTLRENKIAKKWPWNWNFSHSDCVGWNNDGVFCKLFPPWFSSTANNSTMIYGAGWQCKLQCLACDLSCGTPQCGKEYKLTMNCNANNAPQRNNKVIQHFLDLLATTAHFRAPLRLAPAHP